MAPHLRAHARAAPIPLTPGFAAAPAGTAVARCSWSPRPDAPTRGPRAGGLLAEAWARLGGLFDGSATARATVLLGVILLNAALIYAFQT